MEEAELSSIRLATRWATAGLGQFAEQAGMPLRPLPIGRPKKRKTVPKDNGKARGMAEKRVTVPNGTAGVFGVAAEVPVRVERVQVARNARG